MRPGGRTPEPPAEPAFGSGEEPRVAAFGAAGASPTSGWHLRVQGDGPEDLRRARQAIADLARLGAMGAAIDDVVLATHEVLARAVHERGGRADVTAWYDGGTFVCEIGGSDRTGETDEAGETDRTGGVGGTGRVRPGVGFPATAPEGDRALWMADRLCDGVEVRRSGGVTTVRLRRRAPRRAA